MASEDAGPVWDALSDRFGDALRAVVRYDGFDYDAVTRSDVRERYDDDDALKLVNDVVVNQLILADSADFFRAGRYRAFVRMFDDAWVITRPDDPATKSGFVVSVERGEGESTVDVEQCIQQVEAVVGAENGETAD